MPYDPSLDQSLFCKTFESEGSRLSVNVYSYNNGAKKLQISRENRNMEGEYRFAKMGRLTKDEVKAILPLIQESLEHMN